MGIEDYESRQAVVTCHTTGCENSELPIEVPISWPEYVVICGACNQQITDAQVQEGGAS